MKYLFLIFVGSCLITGCSKTIPKKEAPNKDTYLDVYEKTTDNIIKDGYAQTEHGWYSKAVVGEVETGNYMMNGAIHMGGKEKVIYKPGGYIVSKPVDLKKNLKQ